MPRTSNTKRSPGPVNTNWGSGPVNTKLGARACKYKLQTRAGGQAEGQGPGNTKTPNLFVFSSKHFQIVKNHFKSKWEHFTSDHHRMFRWIILHRERHETKRIENVYISFEFSKARLSGKWTSFWKKQNFNKA